VPLWFYPSRVRCLIPKLAIITEIIAPYRIPVFNAGALRPEIDLHVIFLSENDPSLRQWRVYKDEIKFRYEVLPSWRQRLGRYNLLINRGVFSALNRLRPDAVLCGGYNYMASWQAALWARANRVPLLLWSESTALDKRGGHAPVEFMKARFLSMCEAFVVPGKSSLRYLQELGIGTKKIFTAPNAVDNVLFSALAEQVWRNESRVRSRHSLPARFFLYVGRMVAAKGVFELLEAYAQINPQMRRQIGLVFVGDGPDLMKMKEAAAVIETGTIQFVGFVHREELADFYALSEALIFPTHSDTWGLVVNEAMACGMPVIVSNVAGCAEDLVQDGWNGFVVPPSEPNQLAMAMARVAQDSELRRKMTANSRKRIAEYSPSKWAEGVVSAAKFGLVSK
jgi:1,2-diacylglycerol 3-alpha-glucosyltransferase